LYEEREFSPFSYSRKDEDTDSRGDKQGPRIHHKLPERKGHDIKGEDEKNEAQNDKGYGRDNETNIGGTVRAYAGRQ
jgi:sensor histidine kinase regulating citrate/malate metabolism